MLPLVIIIRDKKRWSCSNFPESGSKLFVYLGEFRKKNNSDVSFICFRSKCHNAPFSLCKLTYFTSYLGTLTSQGTNYFFSKYPHSVEQFTAIFFLRKSVRIYIIFSTLYNLKIYLWSLKSQNVKSICCISKEITFLESLTQGGWFDIF